MKTLPHRAIELVIAVSVVIISLASLSVAVFQGIVMQRTMEASVMPLIQVGHGNFNPETDEWIMHIDVSNTGLGPAQVHYMAMRWNDQLITDTSILMADCCAPEDMPQSERLTYMYNLFRNREMALVFDDVQMRFLAPEQTVRFISFDQPDVEAQPRGHAVWQALDAERRNITYEVCYCSVFEECWRAHFPGHTREAVRQCVAPQSEDDDN